MFEKFGKAEKLLMRLRALKWQATTLLSSNDTGAREDAAAIVADLSALEGAARGMTTEDALTAGEEQLDAIARRLEKLRLQ